MLRRDDPTVYDWGFRRESYLALGARVGMAAVAVGPVATRWVLRRGRVLISEYARRAWTSLESPPG